MDISTYATQGAASSDNVSEALILGATAKTKNSGTLSVATNADPKNAASSGSDTVTISDQAKSLAAASGRVKGSATSGTESSGNDAETAVEKLQKQIKELQQQIKAAQTDGTLTDGERQAKIQQLQAQLLMVQTQLMEAQAQSAGSTSSSNGGTRAEGMAKSLTGA